LLEEAAQGSAPASLIAPAKNLLELSEPVRGLLTDEEINSIFEANTSTARPFDLS
jgi:hypothetical protein